MKIRTERSEDCGEIFDVVGSAYGEGGHASHKQQLLVEGLRDSESFVRELSLVAEMDGEIVGYIVLARIRIITKELQKGALALATIAVVKRYRGKGIGAKLIQKAHRRAKALGFDAVIAVGGGEYFQKFGYQGIKKYGIEVPFDGPDERGMVKELTENALEGIKGTVEYPREFYRKGTATGKVKQ
ncbi:GNAT family N-acetyltransferase [Flavobacterium soli]|uniref:GNAT family N-acetyltransferase n=1 Tax=Flavobacterium soli TaxID=344881 RepID=UPI00054CDCE4|nr:N-acetyltransferase [Flavobacterium soli]